MFLMRHPFVGRGPAFEVPPVWAAKPNPPRESLFESLERLNLPKLLRCDRHSLQGFVTPWCMIVCPSLLDPLLPLDYLLSRCFHKKPSCCSMFAEMRYLCVHDLDDDGDDVSIRSMVVVPANASVAAVPVDASCRCKVSGDLEARASADHPPGTPLWSVFNYGYRREQDAVWAAMRFRQRKEDESSRAANGEACCPSLATAANAATTTVAAPAATTTPVTTAVSSTSPSGDRKAVSVTVDADHPPTAGGMLRAALDSLTPNGSSELPPPPSLLWVDLPCHSDDFDQDDHDKHWSSLPQVRKG